MTDRHPGETDALPLVDGILLIYHRFATAYAPTIDEHIAAFARHSTFPVCAVNTEHGFPGALAALRFRAIVLHYTLFAGDYYHVPRDLRRYLADTREAGTYLVAFFQDEYRACRRRFAFLNMHDVDAVYTCLAPDMHDAVYRAHTTVRDVHTHLPGYVSDDLVDLASRLFVPESRRTIDVGYRGRPLDYFMGRGAQEKREIAERFVARAAPLGLRLDISAEESARVYGRRWHAFMAQCVGTLGTESGTSVFDLDDTAFARTAELLRAEPGLSFDEVERRVLHEYEDRIYYRTISPRHFEAAAFRVTQILYRGEYSGVMTPDVHYLALEKDFSNFDDVMARFRDPAERKRITDRAYNDLIASGRWSYRAAIEDFDRHVGEAAGLGHTLAPDDHRAIAERQRRSATFGRLSARPRWLVRQIRFPGRPLAVKMYRKVRNRWE
jgi:hypothetical protein